MACYLLLYIMHNVNYSTLERFCIHIIKFNYLKIA